MNLVFTEPSPFVQRLGQEKLLILLRSDLDLERWLGLLTGLSPVLYPQFLFACLTEKQMCSGKSECLSWILTLLFGNSVIASTAGF